MITIWIPLICVQPLLEFHRSNKIYQLEQPYYELLKTGKIAIDTCTVGFTESDIEISPQALLHIGDIVRLKQDQKQFDFWVREFIEKGCVRISDEVEICREGG